MSNTPLIAPAVQELVSSLASQLEELSLQSGFIADYAEPGLMRDVLRSLQDTLREYEESLDSAIASEEAGDALGEAGPYFVPFTLGTVSRQLRGLQPLMTEMGKDRPRDTRLALEWLGLRGAQLAGSAERIAETVMDELPPCPPDQPTPSALLLTA